MIQLRQGEAYSDNHRDVSQSRFRGGCGGGCDLECASNDAGGLVTLLEEINKYRTETTRRRPPIGYPRAELPARRSRSVYWSRAGRIRDDRRRVMRKRPARTALNFTRR